MAFSCENSLNLQTSILLLSRRQKTDWKPGLLKSVGFQPVLPDFLSLRCLACYYFLFRIIESDTFAGLQCRNGHTQSDRMVICRLNICIGRLARTYTLHPVTHMCKCG